MSASEQISKTPSLEGLSKDALKLKSDSGSKPAPTQDRVREGFFGKLSGLNLYNVIDFLGSLRKGDKEHSTLSKDESKHITQKINQLVKTQKENFTPENIHKLIDLLSKLNYQKDILVDLDTKALYNMIDNKVCELKPNEVADVMNDFSKLGYNKDDLGIDDQELSNFITSEISNFTHEDVLGLLHAFAQMGDNDSDIAQENLTKLFSHLTSNTINKEISSFEPEEISILVYSLEKLAMFDELLDPSFKKQINLALSPETISELSEQSAFALLQSHMTCDLIFEEKLFNKETINALTNVAHLKTDPPSKLQKSSENKLKNEADITVTPPLPSKKKSNATVTATKEEKKSTIPDLEKERIEVKDYLIELTGKRPDTKMNSKTAIKLISQLEQETSMPHDHSGGRSA